MTPFRPNKPANSDIVLTSTRFLPAATAIVTAGVIAVIATSHAQQLPTLERCLNEATTERALNICEMASTGAIGSDVKINEAAIHASEKLRSQSRHKDAIELLTNRPSTAALNLELGNVYFELGDVQSADFHYEIALLAGVPMTDAIRERMLNAAYIYAEELQFSAVKPEAAIDAYTRAIELDPDHMRSHLGRGQAYLTLQQFELACKDLGRAITLGADWTGYLMRARCHDGLADTEAARSDYEMVLKQYPGHLAAKRALSIP